MWVLLSNSYFTHCFQNVFREGILFNCNFSSIKIQLECTMWRKKLLQKFLEFLQSAKLILLSRSPISLTSHGHECFPCLWKKIRYFLEGDTWKCGMENRLEFCSLFVPSQTQSLTVEVWKNWCFLLFASIFEKRQKKNNFFPKNISGENFQCNPGGEWIVFFQANCRNTVEN